MKRPKACRLCRWWVPGRGSTGQCRVRSPVYGLEGRVDCWPTTSDTAWCQQWSSIPRPKQRTIDGPKKALPQPGGDS